MTELDTSFWKKGKEIIKSKFEDKTEKMENMHWRFHAWAILQMQIFVYAYRILREDPINWTRVQTYIKGLYISFMYVSLYSRKACMLKPRPFFFWDFVCVKQLHINKSLPTFCSKRMRYVVMVECSVLYTVYLSSITNFTLNIEQGVQNVCGGLRRSYFKKDVILDSGFFLLLTQGNIENFRYGCKCFP